MKKLLIPLLLLAAPLQAERTYVCIDKSGKTQYSDQACSGEMQWKLFGVNSEDVPPELIDIAVPFDFIGLYTTEAARLFNTKINEGGNLTVQTVNYNIYFESNAKGIISFIRLSIEQSLCDPSKGFNDSDMLMKLAVSKANLYPINNSNKSINSYNHHLSKTKVMTGCFGKGFPYELAISKSYYLN